MRLVYAFTALRELNNLIASPMSSTGEVTATMVTQSRKLNGTTLKN